MISMSITYVGHFFCRIRIPGLKTYYLTIFCGFRIEIFLNKFLTTKTSNLIETLKLIFLINIFDEDEVIIKNNIHNL